jgi:CRP-like cAMP-binding protein
MQPLLTKLSVRSLFTPDEQAALLALPQHPERVPARHIIVAEGDVVSRACVLLDGFAARYKLLPGGERQIVSFHLAGDVIDLHSVLLKRADHGIVTLTDARVAYLPHGDMLEAMAEHPGIMRAVWYETLIDGAIFREWLLSIGKRDGYARLAHLLCEMAMRSEATGLGTRRGYQLPVTQGELGDTTGMTAVHANRMLQRLRADGLITTRGSEMRIDDWSRLAAAGGFDASYLYLGTEQMIAA